MCACCHSLGVSPFFWAISFVPLAHRSASNSWGGLKPPQAAQRSQDLDEQDQAGRLGLERPARRGEGLEVGCAGLAQAFQVSAKKWSNPYWTL
jgi:hypothetical protein